MSPNPSLGINVQQADIEDVLATARMDLMKAQNAIGDTLMPTLRACLSSLLSLIGKLSVIRGNSDMRRTNANTIQSIILSINATAKLASKVVDDAHPNDRTTIKTMLQESVKKIMMPVIKNLQKADQFAFGLSPTSAVTKYLHNHQNSELLVKIRSVLLLSEKCWPTIDETIKYLPFEYLYFLLDVHPDKISSTSLEGVCPGTRARVLEELEHWAKGPSTGSSSTSCQIFVLNGAAGTGKSTIACEMRNRLQKEHLLGAFHCFKRNEEQDMTSLIPAIAFRLATSIPNILPNIIEAARAYAVHPEQTHLSFQLETLLLGPLKKLAFFKESIVIIVDALDECNSPVPCLEDLIFEFLDLFMRRISEIPFLRLIITTRPEAHIQEVIQSSIFREYSRQIQLDKLPRESVDGDIGRYLETSFRLLSRGEELLNARPNLLHDLTVRAEGVFAFARFFVTLTMQLGEDAMPEVLNAIQNDGPQFRGLLHSHTDSLFLSVLQSAFSEQDLERPRVKSLIQTVLGSIVVLQDHLSLKILAELLGTSHKILHHVVSRFESVIIKVDAEGRQLLRPLHSSFLHFLVDPKRCGNPVFLIHPIIHHTQMASACLRILNEDVILPQDLYHISTSTIYTAESLYEWVKQNVPLHIQYACTHWASHLCSATINSQVSLLLEEFLSTKILRWLEIMGYMGMLEVASGIPDIVTWYNADAQSSSDTFLSSLIEEQLYLLHTNIPIIQNHIEDRINSWKRVDVEKIARWRSSHSTKSYGKIPPTELERQDFIPVDLTGLITQEDSALAGGGGYADVYPCTLTQGRESLRVAVKVIRSHIYPEGSQRKIEQRIRREIWVWQRLHHGNVVPFLGVTLGFGHYASMVCPWMGDGDLNHYLEMFKETLALSDRLALLHDVVEGLFYLHSESVIHGDLTPLTFPNIQANILIDQGRACLSDFGLSTIVSEFHGTSFMTSNLVTGACRWAAPELYPTPETSAASECVPQSTKASDVYSFGCVALQVISGRLPYEDLPRNQQVLLELFHGRHARRPTKAQFLSDDIWEQLIVPCLNRNSLERPEIREVRESTLGFLRPKYAGETVVIYDK